MTMKARATSPRSESKPQEVRENQDDFDLSCPRCGRGFASPLLLLPCSHTLCRRCLVEGAGLEKSRALVRGGSACTVLCPCCCRRVELPCPDPASAARCLPPHPKLTPLHPAERGAEGTVLEEEEEEVGKRKMTKDDSVDLSEEEMEQSVSGLQFALDPSSADPLLQLTNSSLTATFRGHAGPPGDVGDQVEDRNPCDPLPQVCGDVVIHRGQYYWEVDVCNSALYRIGVTSLAAGQSWWFERCGSLFHAQFDGQRELLPGVPPHLKTVGVFLNVGGACLTFHNPVTQELLATVPSRLAPPLHPAFQLGQGRLKLRPGLSPPPHVFLSGVSAYRGRAWAGPGRGWRRDVAFGSVRAVIQKFEEMTTKTTMVMVVSDCDSGLTSSYSSSSTLASLPEHYTHTQHNDEC